MVEYPNLSNLGENSGINDFMALPNASFPFFWSIIILGIFTIITLTLYYREKSLRSTGNLLSSAAVSSLFCIVLTLIGTIVNIITFTASLPIFVLGVIIIVMWIFSQ